MKDTTGVCSLALTETLAGSLGQSSVPSCLHCRARRAKWQVELLPEKCTHAGPLCLLLSLSSPPVALLRLAFCSGPTLLQCVATVAGKRLNAPHTHTHSLTPVQQESAWKQNPEAAYQFFLWTFFLWLACLETEGGSKKEGREHGGREGAMKANRVGKSLWLVKSIAGDLLSPPLFSFSLAMRAPTVRKGNREGWHRRACLRHVQFHRLHPAIMTAEGVAEWERLQEDTQSNDNMWEDIDIELLKLCYTCVIGCAVFISFYPLYKSL